MSKMIVNGRKAYFLIKNIPKFEEKVLLIFDEKSDEWKLPDIQDCRILGIKIRFGRKNNLLRIIENSFFYETECVKIIGEKKNKIKPKTSYLFKKQIERLIISQKIDIDHADFLNQKFVFSLDIHIHKPIFIESLI